MDEVLTNQGLAVSSLIIRETPGIEGKEPTVVRRIAGDELARVVRVLRRFDELVTIAERRGVRFLDLLSARGKDPAGAARLPTHRVTWVGGEAFAWSEEQAREIAQRHGIRLDEIDAADGEPTPPGAPAAPASEPSSSPTGVLRELHENRELEKLFEQLARFGLSIEDYGLVQEESVTGERLPTKYAWEVEPASAATAAPAAAGSDESEERDDRDERGVEASFGSARSKADAARVVEVPNLAGVLGGLHEVGRRGLEIKRFKGLGEMDAEQLWDTTMDYTRRTLLRVTWDVAGEADSLFSILMGEDVESRRRFIEEHALEVRNLDV
ncbi:MAG: hypothetical protein JNM07_13635 [Phycisphaerae bacterium]|nr:hypothetical protein [Phycisphaerae bacterium]